MTIASKMPDRIWSNMRGLAIMAIAVHNLLHLVPEEFFVQENEICFHSGLFKKLLTSISSLQSTLPGDLLSHFGWYGVVVFVFLSGYGLSRRYDEAEKFSVRNFCCRSYLKLLKLLVFYPLYLAIFAWCGDGDKISWFGIGKMLSMTGNLFYPFEYPEPGVYWYFSLTMQFYLLYPLLRRFRSAWLLAAGFVLPLTAMALLEPVSAPLIYLRGNCFGWLPVFVAGIAFARMRLTFELRRLELFLLLIIASALLFAFACEFHLWLFSVFPALIVFFALSALVVWRPLQYLGAISAWIFALHPLLRLPALSAIAAGYGVLPVTLLYLALSVFFAAVIHQKFQFKKNKEGLK